MIRSRSERGRPSSAIGSAGWPPGIIFTCLDMPSEYGCAQKFDTSGSHGESACIEPFTQPEPRVGMNARGEKPRPLRDYQGFHNLRSIHDFAVCHAA
jgi:hypothetical protein